MSVTLHFQSTGTVPGNGQPFKMLGKSLTVGRSDQNDLMLPDPDKVVSGRHCAIEDHGGEIVAIDLSTNGTFLNYGKIALGKTPTPLNDGDILSIGPYELMVEIPPQPKADILPDLDLEGEFGMSDSAPPPSVSRAIPADLGGPLGGEADDFLDGLLGAPTAGPASVQRDQLGDDGLLPPLGQNEDDLLAPLPDPNAGQGASFESHGSAMADSFPTPGPATSAIPDDWDMDLSLDDDSDDADPFSIPAVDPVPAAVPDIPVELEDAQETILPAAMKATTQVVAPPVAAPEPTEASNSDAARSFLKSLGADDLNLPDAELEPTLSRLGHVLRTMIYGVREILMTRTSIKAEFRINQTMISTTGNNPLKFSVSPEQAIEAMVKSSTKGYLDPAEAAHQALNDIKAHEVAMMTGMEAALKGVLAKLEPSELAKRIEADSGFRAALTGKKARYWDAFETRYEEIADQAENDFHDLFSKEFARAYQEQLERLK